MWCFALIALVLSPPADASSPEPADSTIENDLLRVVLDPMSGGLVVFDKVTRAGYTQPVSTRDALQCVAGEEIVVRHTSRPVELDGALNDWVGTPLNHLCPDRLSPGGRWQVDGAADLEAAVGFRWDDSGVSALFLVSDDKFLPGSRQQKAWQSADSVEWWAGWDQTGLMLDPKDPGGFLWGDWKDWSKVAVRQVADFSQEADTQALLETAGLDWAGRSGYIVESTTAPVFITLAPPQPGRRFRLAFGVNDADEPGKRGAQLYIPAGYDEGRTGTYAVGLLADESGNVPPATHTGETLCSDVVREDDHTLSYTLAADLPEATVGHVRCTVTLRDGSRDVEVTCRPVEGWEWGMPLFRGFLPDGPGSEYVAAVYGDGILIPADDLNPPVERLGSFSDLDLPAVGVTGPRGSALCMFQQYDCMSGALRAASWGLGQRLGLIINGESQRDKRLPEYRMTWYFSPGGGITDLARRLREFCDQQGWVRTLREKAQANPNVDRLIGAANVWGSTGESFALAAKAAGIPRLLVNGSFPPEQIARIAGLGYLCGEYDQYVDVDDATEDVNGVKPLPAHIRVHRDGGIATGWLTLDGKHQYYSRCSEMALVAAKQKVPRVLSTHPFNARFMDVHTAMGLVECYSKEHPCTTTEDRENKTELLQWMRDQGLVLGGEHGRAWSAPVLDYQEGMMSGNYFFSWPAGHLVPIEKADEISDRYLEWGIGYHRRVPFWELVFHDCVVSTWYWGDTIGYHERVRPDITDRKVAFTALYGTQPMFWASPLCLGFEGKGKERFLDAYRKCCNIHRAVGYERMVSHEFLTPDRSLQRTRFSDGTEVTVNFGPEPGAVESGGKTWMLAANGIVADGPQIHEHVAVVDGASETCIEGPGYRFLDSRERAVERGGLRAQGPLTAQVIEPGHIRLSLEPGTAQAALDPTVLDPAFSPDTARLLEVANDLAARRELPLAMEGAFLPLPIAGGFVTYELLYGDAGARPDARLSVGPMEADAPVTQGAPCEVRAEVYNAGAGAAKVALRAYWDAFADDRLAGEGTLEVPARGRAEALLSLDTSRVVGTRTALVVADSGVEEFVTADNQASLRTQVLPATSPQTVRRTLTLDPKGTAHTDAVIELPVDFTGATAGRALDPASVVVAAAGPDGDVVGVLPTQFEPAEGFDPLTKPAGTVVLVWQGRHSEPQDLTLLASTGSALLPPAAGDLEARSRVLTRETYRADLSTGAIRPLSYVAPDGAVEPMIARIVFSSGETGWAEDSGELKSFDVLASGPVRTVVRTVKLLPGEQRVTRTYAFYANRFTVDASATHRQTGLFSRVWYAVHAKYEDDGGHSRDIDGLGKDEGVGYADPHWYRVSTDNWTHTCIALSPMDGQSFWDEAPSLGQLGFSSPTAEHARYCHVITGPQSKADLSIDWYRELTTPIEARVEGE